MKTEEGDEVSGDDEERNEGMKTMGGLGRATRWRLRRMTGRSRSCR